MRKFHIKDKIASFFQMVLFVLLKIIIAPYIIIFHRVRFKKNKNKIPRKPCIFLSNHQSNWDAIYLEIMFFWRIIHVLAHDELFQNKLFAFLAGKILGAVKRGNGQKDLSAIKKLVQLKNQKKNIAIYPEGDISPFGKLLPVDDGIAKLVQKLKMPLVLMRINGAYLRTPRWGKKLRKSRITYNVVRVITSEEMAKMSVKELHDTILSGINYDEMEYVSKQKLKVRRMTRRANYLERCLFYCPNCKSLHTLKTFNNQIKCVNCGFSATLKRNYFLKSNYECCPIDPSKWDELQRRILPELLENASTKEPIAVLEKARLYVTATNMFFNGKHDNGTAKLYLDRIEYHNTRGYITVIPFDIMDKVQLEYKSTLQIKSEHVKFRISRHKKLIWSAYMWVTIINYLKNKTE